MASTELKHQGIAKIDRTHKRNAAAADCWLKRGARGSKLHRALIIGGAEQKAGKYRNELPFEKTTLAVPWCRNWCSRNVSDTFHYTRIGEASLDIYARCDMNQLKTASWKLKAFLLTNTVKRCSLSIIWFILLSTQNAQNVFNFDNFFENTI